MGGTIRTITITINAVARSARTERAKERERVRESRYCLSTEIVGNDNDEEDAHFLERTSRF